MDLQFFLGLLMGILIAELAILKWFPFPKKNGVPLRDFPLVRNATYDISQHYVRVIQYSNGGKGVAATYARTA